MSERGAVVRARPEPPGARWGRRPRPAGAGPWRQLLLRRRCWLIVGGLLAAGTCWAALGRGEQAVDSAFSQRLSRGCEKVEPCRRLEALAERRVADCWGWCPGREAELRAARSLRYRAEERRAVREHYRQRAEAERGEQQRQRAQQLELRQRELAARNEAAEREHGRRLQLERLEQERLERRLSERRKRRVAYLGLLGVEGRARALRRCAATPAGCGEVISELLDAATGAQERRALAELHEQLLDGAEPEAQALRSADSS